MWGRVAPLSNGYTNIPAIYEWWTHFYFNGTHLTTCLRHHDDFPDGSLSHCVVLACMDGCSFPGDQAGIYIKSVASGAM